VGMTISVYQNRSSSSAQCVFKLVSVPVNGYLSITT